VTAVEFDRKKMVHAFEAARDCGPYDELPVLVADRDPQLHLSRNDRPQPFFLICSSDTLLAQLSGTAILELKYSPVQYHRLEPGDVVYVPAGTPTRIRPEAPSVHLRYKALHAGLEGVAWFCTACGQEVHREEFDTEEELSQDGYWRACTTFNADVELRRCPECGKEHELVDLTGIRWPEVAQAIRETAR
jgi:3-hydroxyanthranilate 3,4-dioxygenase